MSELKTNHHHHHGLRFVLALVGLVLLAGIITLALLRDRIVNDHYQSVTINGQGKVAYQPDLALVTLGVQIDKVSRADEALNQLNAKVNDIIKAVRALGIPAADIQTQNYSLYPQYDYRDNVSSVSGYNANEQLVIKVSGYDKSPELLSTIIAAASKAGANQVNSLTFDSSVMNDLKQQARILAIQDAKDKSNDLALAASVRLDRIIGWYENLVNPVAMYSDYGKGGMESAAMNLNPNTPSGSREVIVEVGVTYRLKPDFRRERAINNK